MSYTWNPQTGQWEYVPPATATGTTTTTTPSSTTTKAPTTSTTVAPSTTTGTTIPTTTTTQPPITVTSTGTTGTTGTAGAGAGWEQALREVIDQSILYKEGNDGDSPPNEWWTANLLPVKDAMDKEAADRDAIAERNKTIADRIYQDRVRAEDNARDDKIRAAELELRKAAAGSAAAARAQERRDALEKEKRDRKFQLASEYRQEQFQIDRENRANKRADALEAVARLRGIEGGNAAADILESRAGQRTLEGLQRIKELYDPMQEMSSQEFAQQVQLLAEDFKVARGQVAGAGEDFLKNFVNSVAYNEVPITTLEAPTNPLLDALKAQGAGEGEVEAVSNFAKQFAKSSSDLGKWAASQLNVGQQNFDVAAKRASMGATTAALQGLAGEEPRIKAGMQSQYNKRMQDIAMQRAQASENVYNRQYDAEDRAAAIRAETLAKYGKPDEPKEETTGDAAAVAAEAARKKAEEEARKAAIAQVSAARKAEF